MKRKRAYGGNILKKTLGKKKLQVGVALVAENDVINEESGEPEINMSLSPLRQSVSGKRREEIVTSQHMEKYPNALREMIVSVIKELSKEAGGLANLSRSLVDNAISNEQMTQPHADMDLKENKSQMHQNPEHKEQGLDAALRVIKKTMSLDAADPFNRPVDPVALEIPDYFDVIDTPMDFGTICNNLENGLKYLNSADVFKDVEYIWYNCLKYNKKGDYILELMNRVKTFFMRYWTAAGLQTGQSESIVEPGLHRNIHNEEHSGCPVTPVAESSISRHNKRVKDYPLAPLADNFSHLRQKDAGSVQVAESHPTPVNMQAGHSSPEQDEPNIDSTVIQKKRQGRGPTRCLKLLTAVGRIKIVTNELGQPIGREASLLTSFLGLTARDGNLAPLIYPSWIKVPEENKENMWQKVLTKFDIDPSCRSWVLMSLGTKWRNFKSLLKATHYDTHMTDEERLADRDERVLPDQWAVLVSQWSSEKWKSISAKNKANRARQKFSHTSGKKSFARIREEEKAKRADGKEPSRAELFILTRTRKNGQPVNEETAAVISQLRESAPLKEANSINNNEPQDDAYNRVLGVDRKGGASLLGLNAATPSRSGSEIPTRAEALRMVTEKNEEVIEMKEKLAAMEQTCSQMAAQMSLMVSMMATMQKDKGSPAENFSNAVAGTLVPVGIPHQSEPTTTSIHEVLSKKTRGRKKRR